MSTAESLEQATNPTPGDDHVFISYAHKDKAFARRLAKDLRSGGKKFWIDEDLGAGTVWPQEIEAQILAASKLYLVMSPDAKLSKYTMGEATLADSQGIEVVPVLWRECVLPPPFNVMQWADCTTLEKYRKALPDLLGPDTPRVKVPWYVRYLVWDRWIGALITVAVLLVLAAAGYYRFSPSDTSVVLHQTNSSESISLLLENHGGLASTNKGGYRIKFGDLPIEDRALDVVKKPTTVEGHHTEEIVLKAPSGFKPKLVGGRYLTADEIGKLLPGHKITVAVDVEEAAYSTPTHPLLTRRAVFDADQVRGFITIHLPTIPGVQDEP